MSLAQYKGLLKLAEKLGMDVTNTIRYAIARVLEAEAQVDDHERGRREKRET